MDSEHEQSMKPPERIRIGLALLAGEIDGDLPPRVLNRGANCPGKEWSGGDVIVTSDFERKPVWMEEHKRWVRTRHARELSWLIRQLRDLFLGWLYFGNKYGFYGALARTALQHLAENQPESNDPRPLLHAVLNGGQVWVDIVEATGGIPDNAGIVIHHTDGEGCQTRIDAVTGRDTD